jgi:hypothetical protein
MNILSSPCLGKDAQGQQRVADVPGAMCLLPGENFAWQADHHVDVAGGPGQGVGQQLVKLGCG